MRDVTSASFEERVLVLAPFGRDAELTRVTLTRAGIEAQTCTTLDALCSAIRDGAGAVVVAEEALSDRALARLQTVLSRQPSWSDLPLLMLSREGADSETVIASMHALGNVTVLERPLRVAALVSAVRAAMRARRRQYEIRSRLAEREQAARTLADTVESLNIAMEAGNMGAYTIDLAAGEALWTDSAFQILGMPRTPDGRVRVSDWRARVHPDDQQRTYRAHDQARASGARYQFDYRFVRPDDGRMRWIATLGHFLPGPDGTPMRSTGIFYDFTERRATEDELRNINAHLGELVEQRTAELRDLSHHLLWATEQEKRGLARELHDELGSLLTAINLDLGAARRKLDRSAPEVAALIERAMGLVESSAHVKRRIMEGLRPSILDMMGLAQALDSLGNDFRRRTGVRCQTIAHGSFEGLDQSVAIACYRIAQEALTNIAKYAAPKDVMIEVTREDHALLLAIEDDGVGLPDGAGQQAGQHGIAGMRERVTALGGRLILGPGHDDHGTRIAAEIPLA